MEDETAVTEMTSITELTAIPTRKIGAFGGVFVPTILSILGVLLYLRLGWVVGNAGLGGALLMLSIALIITVCTGLSLSSIASNTRVGDGGAFEVLTRSLGFEVSGAIGIPLMLTRPLVVAMHVFGFREGLQWIVPSLPSFQVDIVVFGIFFAIAYRGARVAFYLQTLILAVIGVSLLAVVGSTPAPDAPTTLTWWGTFPGSVSNRLSGIGFFAVFAILFPAFTGFLAGAPTRIDLQDPRRTIPVGTMWAIGLSAIVYLAMFVWFARIGTPEELVQNYNLVIERSLSPLIVVIGLLFASGSSALAGLVDAPRILTSLGENRLVPFADAMAEKVDDEPRNAMVVTGMLTFVCLALRTIDAVAPLLTLLFLVTYALINLAYIVEGQLGLITFRPTVKLPWWVPALGLLGSLVVMFLVSPVFALVAVVAMGALIVAVRRNGRAQEDQTRSGMFVTVAEWAASKIDAEDLENPRAWRPNLLVPVVDAEQLRDSYRLLMDVARPEGSIRLMGLATDSSVDELERKLGRLGRSLAQRNLRTTWSMIDLDDYQAALHVGTVSVQGAFLRPNAMFLRLGSERGAKKRTVTALRVAMATGLGVVLYLPTDSGIGNSLMVRVWVRRGPSGWDPYHAFDKGNIHLALLLGMRLARQWGGQLELATIATTPAEEDSATVFLQTVSDMARLPARAAREVYVGEEAQCIGNAPRVDLSIFGFPAGKAELTWAENAMQLSGNSCLFTLDAGGESALV